jgi:hypothetical protein
MLSLAIPAHDLAWRWLGVPVLIGVGLFIIWLLLSVGLWRAVKEHAHHPRH